MYNEFQKLRYLNSPEFRFDESAKDNIRYIFEGAEEVEKQEKMDLCLFNRPQVVRLMKSYNSRSKIYLRLVCNYFSDYYSWCLSEGYVDKSNVTNYYDYTISKPIIEEVVPLSLVKDKYLTDKDIFEYENNIPDPVNKFILYALFCGVYGDEYDDLTHLKLSDINEIDKTVSLYSGITIHINNKFIEMAKIANQATKYTPDGIDTSTGSRNPNRYVYDVSDYIIKNSGTGIENTPVSKIVIMNRFRLMQKQLDNKFINGSNLYKNGLINYVKERFESNGVSLEDGVFLEVDKADRKYAGSTYIYYKELQQYIKEFGSSVNERALRMLLKDVIELFK